MCEAEKVDGQLAVSNDGPRRREGEVDAKVVCSLGMEELYPNEYWQGRWMSGTTDM